MIVALLGVVAAVEAFLIVCLFARLHDVEREVDSLNEYFIDKCAEERE